MAANEEREQKGDGVIGIMSLGRVAIVFKGIK